MCGRGPVFLLPGFEAAKLAVGAGTLANGTVVAGFGHPGRQIIDTIATRVRPLIRPVTFEFNFPEIVGAAATSYLRSLPQLARMHLLNDGRYFRYIR